jgi:hypothetical protein
MTAIKLHSLPPALPLICGLFNDPVISSDSELLNDRLSDEGKFGKNTNKAAVA